MTSSADVAVAASSSNDSIRPTSNEEDAVRTTCEQSDRTVMTTTSMTVGLDTEAPIRLATAAVVDQSAPMVMMVATLRRRLAQQDKLICRLRTEKDKQLRKITGSLLLLESQLRQEKERVSALVDEKERKIVEQENCIRALLRLNRKLASAAASQHRKKSSLSSAASTHSYCAEDVIGLGNKSIRRNKKQKRRISWHSEVSIYGEDGQRWNASCRESNGGGGESETSTTATIDRFPNIREVSDEEVDDGILSMHADDRCTDTAIDCEGDHQDLVKEADETCDAFDEALDGYVSELVLPDIRSRCLFSRLNTCRLDGPNPDGGEAGGGLDNRTPLSLPPPPQQPNQLGHVYNRVMSNHRSVTKPKDVKYKKISRVKSRSLEELRGRLKYHGRPAMVTLGHLVGAHGLQATSQGHQHDNPTSTNSED